MLDNISNLDSKNIPNSRIEDIKIQLDWIRRLQDQIEFLNNPDVLPDFKLYFSVNRRSSYTATCQCGHNSGRHWEIHGDLKECKACPCEAFYE